MSPQAHSNAHAYDAVIVGAGCAGLIAAYELRHFDILIVEQAQEIGGRILTRRRDGTSYDLGAVFALQKHLLPFHPTLSPLVPESRQIGLFHRGHLHRGQDVAACLQRAGIAAADLANIRDFAAGRSSDLAQASPDARKVVEAFFHVIHPGPMAAYVPERQRDALRKFATDHYRHGNGEVLAYLERCLAGKIRLGTEVLAVAEQAEHLAVTLRSRGATSTVAARTAIVATPAPAALRVLAAPTARSRAFLESVRYAGGLVVALGFAGARLPELAYVVTPQLPCNTILEQTHPDTDRQVLLVYYVGEQARRLQPCDDALIAAQTLSHVRRVFADDTLVEKLVFSDVQRWPLVGPVIAADTYAMWDERCLEPAARVFLAGDYTHVDASAPLPYGLPAAIASGVKAAGRVKGHLAESRSGAADYARRCLIDASVYALKEDQPLFLRRNEEGNVAFYGLLLQAEYDAELHHYLLSCRRDSLWEYHSGFGVTAEDSLLVLEALSALPQDAAVVADGVRRLVELFYSRAAGAFCTLSPHRDGLAACAKGRARYWQGPSVDATAQAGYLLHKTAPDTYAREIEACAEYLARSQHATGRWKGRWFPSSLTTTYHAMRFLHEMGPSYRGHVASARQFLLDGQQPDGSWGQSVIDTAAGLLALHWIGEPAPRARAWLEAQRGPTGWRGEAVLYYWFELNARQKLFYHCTDKGRITSAWASLALRAAHAADGEPARTIRERRIHEPARPAALICGA